MIDNQTQCPHCGFAYAVAPEQAAAMAGRSFPCTRCGQSFELSAGGAAFAQPTQPVSYASGAEAKPNPLAIASLICGCFLCVPVLPGIASIVCGAIGLRKTRDPAVTGKGLAIAGLVLGALNLLGWGAYIALVSAIMLPSLGRARQTANQVKCASNMRQIGMAILLYSNENGGAYPNSLDQLLLTQDVTSEIFVCPSSGDTKATGANPQAVAADMASGKHLSYVYVGKGMTDNTVLSDAQFVVVAYEPLTNHTNAGTNMLYADGHVDFVPKAQAAPMIKQIEAGQNPPSAGAGIGSDRSRSGRAKVGATSPATAPVTEELEP